MPSIDELIKKHKEPSKKFQKKSYRPWDALEETSDEESSKQEEVPPVVLDKKVNTSPLEQAPKVIVEKKGLIQNLMKKKHKRSH